MPAFQIVWESEALAAAQHFMADDPTGLAAVFDLVDTLARSPRPPDAVPWGGTHYRLRVGAYRVLYEISEELITISVIHLGQSRRR